nr:MAG TPA: Protein of unknown function (DUF4024) [Caudoviricetes sp.]
MLCFASPSPIFLLYKNSEHIKLYKCTRFMYTNEIIL